MTPQLPSVDTDFLQRLGQLPRYRVLLHNDDFNDMDHVVRALLTTVRSLDMDDAVRIMLEAHLTGTALVTICPLETAEFYRDGLRDFGIGSTIEPE